MTHQEAISLFKEVKQGELVLTIGRRNTNHANITNEGVKHVERSCSTSKKNPKDCTNN